MAEINQKKITFVSQHCLLKVFFGQEVVRYHVIEGQYCIWCKAPKTNSSKSYPWQSLSHSDRYICDSQESQESFTFCQICTCRSATETTMGNFCCCWSLGPNIRYSIVLLWCGVWLPPGQRTLWVRNVFYTIVITFWLICTNFFTATITQFGASSQSVSLLVQQC